MRLEIFRATLENIEVTDLTVELKDQTDSSEHVFSVYYVPNGSDDLRYSNAIAYQKRMFAGDRENLASENKICLRENDRLVAVGETVKKLDFFISRQQDPV